jgi:hypothetical protein
MKKWYILSTVHIHHRTTKTPIGNPNYREYTVIEGYPITIYSEEKPDFHYEDIKCYLQYAFEVESPFKQGRASIHNMSFNIINDIEKEEFEMWPEKKYTFQEYCHGAYYANHDTNDYRQLMTPTEVLKLSEQFAIYEDDYK